MKRKNWIVYYPNKSRIQMNWEKAVSALEPLGEKAKFLKELAYFMLNRAF